MSDRASIEEFPPAGGPEISPEAQKRGMRLVYGGQSAGIILMILIAQPGFGVLFVKHLGGSDTAAMVLGAVLGVVRLVQIPASLRVHPASGKRFLLTCQLIYAAIMLVAAALPSLMGWGAATAWAFVLAAFAGLTISNLGSTFWFPILHDVVPADRRGRFFGTMRAAWSTSSLLATIVAGFFLGRNPSTWQFQVVILMGVGGVLLRNALFHGLPTADAALSKQDDFSDWRKHTSAMLSRRDVLSLCGYLGARGLCVGFLLHPLVLYIKSIGFADGDNILINAARLLGTIPAFLLAGQLVDRLGTKRVLISSHIVMCLLCVGVAATGLLPRSAVWIVMPAMLIVAGMMQAAGSVAATTHLFFLAPDRGRAFFLCLSNVVIVFGAALAPLIAGSILPAVPEGWTLPAGPVSLNIYQVMLASAGVGLLALLGASAALENIRPRQGLDHDG